MYRMQGTYPGDVEAAEIFERAGSFRPLGEIKAFLAGILMGLSYVPPSQVLEEMEFGELGELPHFANDEAANEFMSTFFGLWNDIAKHRDPNQPFSFSPSSPSVANTDIKAWLSFAEIRAAELGEFLCGLGVSETPTLAELVEDGLANPDKNYLPQNMAKNLGHLEKEIQKQKRLKNKSAEKLIGIIKEVDHGLKAYHKDYIELLHSIEVVPEPIRHTELKVGRNDSCPCGSGKKFKKCCLQ